MKFGHIPEVLSDKERGLVSYLMQAVEATDDLYQRQKNSALPGANFYPPDASKKEIEQAAKKNPAILDPYTFVERAANGKLIATPYVKKFEKELTRISNLLKEAAEYADDLTFRAYIRARAEDLLRETYDESNLLWVKSGNAKVGFVLGAFDRYLDQLFFRKRAYMGWVGILDEPRTREMAEFTKAFLSGDRKHLPGAKNAQVPQARIRVEDTLVFAGLIGDFSFVGSSLPSFADAEFIKRYGTMFTMFKPSLANRFESIFEIFRTVFSQEVQNRYSKESLRHAFLYISVLHEASHNLMRYEDAVTRLQEFFPYFDEGYADILSIKGCGPLLLQGVFTEWQLEALLLMNICESIYFCKRYMDASQVGPYAIGSTMSLDFLLQGKALIHTKNGFEIDAYRAFVVFDQLSHIFEYYIAIGTYNEAKVFLRRAKTKKTFAHFAPYIEDKRQEEYALV